MASRLDRSFQNSSDTKTPFASGSFRSLFTRSSASFLNATSDSNHRVVSRFAKVSAGQTQRDSMMSDIKPRLNEGKIYR